MDIDDMASAALERIMKDQVVPEPTIFVLFEGGDIALTYLEDCLDCEQCEYLLEAGQALYLSSPGKQISEICYIRITRDEKNCEVLLVQMAYAQPGKGQEIRCHELIRDEVTGVFIASAELYEPRLSEQTRDCPRHFLKGSGVAQSPVAEEFNAMLARATAVVARIEQEQRFARVRQSQRRGRSVRANMRANTGGH